MLRTVDHNHILYIFVNIDKFKLSHILVDPGASVNKKTLRTLAYLKVDTHKHSYDKMILQGSNEKGKRALGSVTLLLEIESLKIKAKFYIIVFEDSSNSLLDRPWIHKYRMVHSIFD